MFYLHRVNLQLTLQSTSPFSKWRLLATAYIKFQISASCVIQNLLTNIFSLNQLTVSQNYNKLTNITNTVIYIKTLSDFTEAISVNTHRCIIVNDFLD